MVNFLLIAFSVRWPQVRGTFGARKPELSGVKI